MLDEAHRRDLLEVLDDRHGSCSTILTSQLAIEHWRATIGDATVADAILDRPQRPPAQLARRFAAEKAG